MENKLGVSAFAQRLSLVSGKPKKLCEDFIKEMFRLCAESLEAGENVRIKGFGTFKTVDSDAKEIVSVANGERKTVDAHKKVVFTPAKELAEVVNSPFALFETLELDESPLTPEGGISEEEISDENKVAEPILEAGSDEEGDDDEITAEAYQERISPLTHEGGNVEPIVNLPVYYEGPQEESRKFGKGFLWGAVSMFALCLLIFTLGCFFDWWPVNFGKAQNLVTSAENQVTSAENQVTSAENQVTSAESQVMSAEDQVTSAENQVTSDNQHLVEEVSKPEEPKVYDTVSTTRYLTTIAREHYGNFNFWPYIYEENKAILGHPDRITPGTKVVVPPLSKYGVDVKNKDDIETAKKKGAEIYDHFR